MKNLMKKMGLMLLAMALILTTVACGAKDAKTSETKEVAETSDKKVLKVGVAAVYRPWCYQEDGEIIGVDVDVLQEIAKRMGGYEIEYQVSSFSGMFGLLDTGRVDTVAQQITITPKREEKYDFSEIYAYNPYVLYVKEDSTIENIEDLKGKKIVCNPTGSDAEFFEEYKRDNDPNDEIELILAELEDQWREVDLARYDACADAVPYGIYKLASGEYKLKAVGDTIFEEQNAFPFRKDMDPEVFKKFNEAIVSMREDGTLKNIYLEYFNEDLSLPSVNEK